MQKHVMAPYFNPELRWWDRDDRLAVNLGVQIRLKYSTLQCSILDISAGGCFVETNEEVVPGVSRMRIRLSDLDLTALGKVVWVNRRYQSWCSV
jgi:hypothetical protein